MGESASMNNHANNYRIKAVISAKIPFNIEPQLRLARSQKLWKSFWSCDRKLKKTVSQSKGTQTTGPGQREMLQWNERNCSTPKEARWGMRLEGRYSSNQVQ